MLPRALVLLLTVMNLGLFAWWTLHASAPMPRVPATEPGVPPLVLLSEAEAAREAGHPVDPSAELDAAPDPLSATPLCLTLGPLQSQADLRRAMNTLTPAVGRIQFRKTRGTELRGYRVFIPAFATRDLALAGARDLAAKGVRDYYVVTSGAQENTISLGLFNGLPHAEKRRDEARAFGFDARLEPRTEDADEYWIDIAAARDFDWHPLLAGFAGIGAKPIACF
jgi:hypothetical protein